MEVASMSGLIEGLPDAVALMCLARVPYYIHPRLELVSRSWKAAIHSAELFRVRQEVGSSEDLLCVCSRDPNITWQIYDPLRDLWMTLPEIPSKKWRMSYFGAVSISQKLFVLGGHNRDLFTSYHDGNFVTNEVWSYNLVTRKWSTQAPMLAPRAAFSWCVLDGKIIIAGGFTSFSSGSTSRAEMYDPEKDSWVVLPDLLWPHASEFSGMVIGGKMHIVQHGFSRVQIFDNLEMKWRVEDYGWPVAPMAAVRDSVYVLCQGKYILKLDGPRREVVVSASKFHGMSGMAMIGFRDELYVIGGVLGPKYLDGEFVLLSDVHVLTLEGEKPTWRNAAPMTRCRGTILGCTQLRI